MRAFVIFGLFVAAAVAVPMPEADNKLDCFNQEQFLTCMAIKANSVINRAARSNNLELIEGVKFIRDGAGERSAKALESETATMESLPTDSTEKALRLISMLYDSASSFFSTHSLKVDVPEGAISRSLEEARSKLMSKKSWTPIMLALGAKFLLLLPVIFGGLSLLVLKSLFIGKIALIIAGILGFQKLFGAGGSVGSYASNFLNKVQPSGNYYDGAGQAWQTNGQTAQPSQGGYYKRSIDESKIAQNLAYSAHTPDVNQSA